jgi:hypothetical protein
MEPATIAVHHAQHALQQVFAPHALLPSTSKETVASNHAELVTMETPTVNNAQPVTQLALHALMVQLTNALAVTTDIFLSTPPANLDAFLDSTSAMEHA